MPSEPDESTGSVDSLLAAVARIPVEEHWTPPTELEEYKLLRPIGRGGMGSVWLAEDQLLERLVAIKFIAHASPNPHARERFAIEARAAARLQHINVVTVHRFGEVAGRPFLVSEYVRGESLDKVAKPVGWKRALELGVGLARGLAAAHRHGIVHRDIKPSNAILAADGEAKLVDFGLAKIGTVESPTLPALPRDPATAETELTKTGTIAGTPLYLAPEVRAGGPADRRSDVYQLGCILYELVTSRAPFIDAPETQGGDVKLELADTAPFVGVVERCLRRDPQARFASGDELREALEKLAEPVLGGGLPDGNPYRGLLAFESEHRALFFGRGAEIRTVVERLRADPFVLVTADSGAGKSSVCRAGVVPHVVEGALGDGRTWMAAQLVPGTTPLSSFVAALAHRVDLDETKVAKLATEDPAELVREIRKALGRERGLLVFVDQLEELVTIGERRDADVAARVLAHLASGVPGIKLLATVRSDFLTRLGELPELSEQLSRALYLLPPLSTEGAREAIVGPARAKGVTFEADSLVDTLADSARALELPLLAFTLAQLWDARDGHVINTRSLEQIGGVRGALARHADGVIAGLLPQQRDVARRLLLRLVSVEKTRSRKTSDELAVFDRAVLDALVRGRLVVARGEEPPAFELAHERLIDGWPTLADWLAESGEAVAAHARLAAAARDWERLDRARERLWGDRQLADLARLAHEDLTPSESAFALASRRAVRRRNVLRIVAALAIPLVIGIGYVTARVIARRDRDASVADRLAIARPPLVIAEELDDVAKRQSALAYAAYDRGERTLGSEIWTNAHITSTRARDVYSHVARELEAAFFLDTSRTDVRDELARITVERIALADREQQTAERTELLTRLSLFDNGKLAAQFSAPAHLHVTTTPSATLSLVRDGKELPLDGDQAPGSYTLLAHADGHAPVAFPLLLAAGDDRRVTLDLPLEGAVPAGFVYVPPGTFLYGARDERSRSWIGTAPLHEMHTGGFLIARTETTYADWIAYLESLPAGERARRTPNIGAGSSLTIQPGGQLELAQHAGVWELRFSPTTIGYHARAGELITYKKRTLRQKQDWLKMPVSGISPEDSEAYTAWLAKTGKIPHARLCTEAEWEHAARGADGRDYPNGDHLEPDDADIDVTYGQLDGGFGPDEVGSHPARSPFGLVDVTGNVWEITRSLVPKEYVIRGGAFFNDASTAAIENRNFVTPDFKHLHIGLRVCADAP